MKKNIKLAAIALAAVLTASSAFADEKGYEIMKKVADFKEPAFTHTLVTISLKDKNGSGEDWVVEEYGKSKDGLASLVMLFRKGSKKDTRFLQIENGAGKADDKFIYLPSLKSTRRVNSSEGSKSFLGTDATYDDLSTRSVDQDEHTYLGDEEKNGYDCHKIKEVPYDKASSQYAYRLTWIDKKSMYPIYTEMYDKNEKLVKTLSVNAIKQMTGASGITYDIPMDNTLTNMATGHSTTMQITQIEIDKPLPDRVFTQAFLTTGK